MSNTQPTRRDGMGSDKWREDLRAGFTIAWVLLLVVVVAALGVKWLLGH
jgi:hypothetical protein